MTHFSELIDIKYHMHQTSKLCRISVMTLFLLLLENLANYVNLWRLVVLPLFVLLGLNELIKCSMGRSVGVSVYKWLRLNACGKH